MAEIKGRAKTKTGFDDFLDVTKKFRGLSLGAIGGGVVTPFVAYLAGMTPPWPEGVTVTTSLAELVALVLAFQFFRPASRKVINRVMGLSAVGLFLASTLYLALFSFATYQIADTKERDVKGFVCLDRLPDATLAQCPFVGQERLKDAAFQAELIWQPWSIQLMRLFIAITWFVAFLLLSSLIGTFIVFQSKQKIR